MNKSEILLTEEDKNRLCKLLKGAVNIPSINPPGKEEKMTEYICGILDKSGIPYELIPVSKGRCDIVAGIKGKNSGNGIMFTGHMDVVPVSEDEEKRWKYPPFSGKIVDNKMYGRGAVDMKSGLCASLFAMCLLAEKGIIPENDVLFVATVDEEDYMAGSKALVGSPLLKGVKSCIICEPTNLELCNAGKGRTWATVKVCGKTGHGSMQGVGDNAIYNAIDLIERIRSYSFPNENPEEMDVTFWRALAIHAQVEPKVVPDECEFVVDARLALNEDPLNIWKVLDRLIEETAAENPYFSAEYNIEDIREPWITEKSSETCRLCSKALEEMKIPVIYNRFQGTTDGTFLRKNDCETVIIGPGDLSCVHRENEALELDQLYSAAEFYLKLMTEN